MRLGFLWWVIGAVLIALIGVSQAAAHEAPSGWPYPGGCCAGVHCAPLPAELVKNTDAGYLIITTGEVIPYDKANSSPDGEYHYCTSRSRHPPPDVYEWSPVRPDDRLHEPATENHPFMNRSRTCFWSPEMGM